VLGCSNAWEESSLTWDNAPLNETGVLDTVQVNGLEQYYELDVTDYVRLQAGENNEVSFLVTGSDYENVLMIINSKEHSCNPPLLVLSTEAGDRILPSSLEDGLVLLSDSFNDP